MFFRVDFPFSSCSFLCSFILAKMNQLVVVVVAHLVVVVVALA